MTRLTILVSVLAVVWSFRTASGDTQTSANEPDSSVGADRPVYVLKFDRLLIDDMRLDDTLSLILESSGKEIAGFSLKFGCTDRYCDIIEVLPGEILDSCKWEFFRAVPDNTVGKNSRPRQLWEVTALAKTTPDSSSPPCLGLDRPASLLKLVVSNEGISEVPDHNAPVFFFWEDCRDNVLSGPQGRMMAVSADVFDQFVIELPDSGDPFPTTRGTPQSCINLNRTNHPERLIQFHNGGVEFKLNIQVDTDDTLVSKSE